MKTIYSLKEFYEGAKALAESRNIDYTSVRVDFDKHRGLVFPVTLTGTIGNPHQVCKNH